MGLATQVLRRGLLADAPSWPLLRSADCGAELVLDRVLESQTGVQPPNLALTG